MSRRNRRREGSQAVDVGSRADIERLVEKGRLREAFKQAKLCFREESSAENRRLLERIYLLRIKDLSQGGMPSAAVEVARHFIEFGVTESAAFSELVSLLPKLGMLDEARRLAARLEAPEAQASLSLALADRTVLHPEQTSGASAEVRQGADRIRASLSALDQQNEDQALEFLKDIPRSSPWADWRYFVRGLAAFRRGDAEQASANWDRLDATRAAARIASRLRATVPDNSPNGERRQPSGRDLSRLEAAVFGESVLTRIDRLRRLIDKTNPRRDWKQAIAQVAFLSATLRRIDRRLAQRLTEILLPSLIEEATDQSYEQASGLLSDFIRVAEPQALDPRWNRLWALCWQRSGETIGAIEYWKSYVQDIESAAGLDADQRRRMQALVWWHVGMLHAEEARDESPPFPGVPSSKKVRGLRERAVNALQESRRLDPARRRTHESLISLYEQWEEPDSAAEAARQLLEAFPNDLETLESLARYHFQRDELERALDYIQRARTLKPLDSVLSDLEHWCYVGLARHHALARRWDKGRAAFAHAESLRPADAGDYSVLARRAIFELKAGEAPRSEELIERAKATLAEPAPVWLSLAIEAARYKVTSAHVARFNRELKAALRKKKMSETAGKLAERIFYYKSAEVEYSGNRQHLRDVLDYLRSTSRTKYAEDDLVHVCQLLQQCPEESRLFDQLLRRGLKNFPHCPVFHMLAAEQELDRGPFQSNLGATRKRLEKALALAEADSQGRYASLIPDVKRKLSMVSTLCEAASKMEAEFGRQGGFPGGLPGFFEMLGSIVDVDDEDDDSDDDYAGYFDPFDPPSDDEPPSRGAGRKRRRAR